MKKTHQNTPGASGKIEAPWLEKYFIKSSYFKASLIVLVFFALGFFIYSNTLESPFVFDDKVRIVDNPAIRIDKLTFQNMWNAAFGKRSARSRPIGNISFALNYYFHQHELAGYHIVNIIIHIISGILLWLFLKKTLNLKSVRPEFSNGEWIALFAAFLWLVNPVQTQSVTYIVQRLNSMAAMFFLLSFLCYLNGRLTTKKRMRWTWFLGAALGWLLALGCKQNAAMLPFFIFLYEWYFFQNLSKDWLKRSLKWVLGLTVLFVIIALIYTDFNPLEKFSRLNDFSKNEFTTTQRALTQLRVVIYYISLLFYPHPSRLNLDYDFPLSYSLINPYTTLLSLILILGLVLLGVYLAKKERLISFCIFWFFGNLVIESSVIPLALIFEHRLYLPSMLLILIPVTLGYRYIKLNWLLAGLLCLAVVVLSVWTYQRNRVWENDLSFWTDVVSKSPNKARPHINLGKSLSELERFDEALDHYLEALRIKPDYAKVYINLGNAMLRLERTDEAINYYRKALRLDPSYASAHNDLGNLLTKQNKVQEAIYHYTEALRLEPGSAETHYNLAIALDKQGKIAEAIKHYAEALRKNPDFADAHYNLGIAFQKQGRLSDAITHFQQALRTQPDFTQALNNLALAYATDKQYAKALRTFKKTAELQPDNASHSYNIACMYALQNNIEESIEWLEKAIDKGYQNWEIIKTDKDLENIRNSEGYRQLIKGQ